MPLFMDRHDIEGVTAKAVIEAHDKDLAVQDKHGAKYLTYWLDEARGHIFCLCDAPSKEIAEQVHREAHGLMANHIIEVDPMTVEAFLGAIDQSPSIVTMGRPMESVQTAATASESLGTSAFRAIVFTDMRGSTALTEQLGDAKAMELLRIHNGMIREAIQAHQGREVKHTGDGFMVAFASVCKAVESAIAILKSFDAYNRHNPAVPIHVKIGLSAGEPVEEDQDFFGATVQLAARLCGSARANKILVSGVVRDLCLGKKLSFTSQGEKKFKGFERSVPVYEVDWTQE